MAAPRESCGGRRLSRFGVVLAALAVMAGCGGRAAGGGEILAYELDLTLGADGSVRVEERARVVFQDSAGARFALPIPPNRIDAVDRLEASLDGRPVGEPEVGLEPEPGGGLSWSGGAGGGAVREFTLGYDAAGVMAVSGARGVFIWPAVPPGVGRVAESTVRLTWPEGSVPMQGPAVSVDGWDVRMSGRSAVMTAREVDRAVAPLVYVDVVVADPTVGEPGWQVWEGRARSLTPAFVAAGLFMIVVAAGILLMIRVQYPVLPGAESGTAPVVSDETARVLASPSLWRASRATREALVGEGLADQGRFAVGHGLRLSGVAVGVAAAGLAAAIPFVAGNLGPAPFAVPGGLAISAVILFIRGATFPALTEAGAEVAMLHSRRLRPSREP